MKNNKTVIISVVAAVVIVGAIIAIVASGKKSVTTTATTSTTSSAASGAVATDSPTISNYMFMPATITVKEGATVTWTNKDSVQHSVTADTVSADAPNGPLFGLNQTYSFTFKKAGTYTFHCELHPYMHGTVIVTS